MRFLKRLFGVLFALAAVCAGFVVTMLFALLALAFFPLRRPAKVTMPRTSGGNGAIDIEATEIARETGE